MNILPARSACCVGLLALTATACVGVRPEAPVNVDQRLERTGFPPVDVRFSIQPEHRRVQQRYVAAAMAALKENNEWLGPLPLKSLTILDPPLPGSPALSANDVIVLDRTPWLSTVTSMTPELAAARGVSRRCWAALVDTGALPPWFVDALTEYAARRVVAALFEQENLSPGYAFYEERYFGRFVPRALRIRLLPESDGDPLPAYRSSPTATAVPAPRSAADMRSLEAKTILTLGTLERWVGRPVFDQLVAEFVRGSRSARPTLADFTRTASDVSGQDLAWLFDEAFGSSRVFDYGVERLTSERDAAGTFATTVVARRYGDAPFTGSSAEPVGGFESGRGVTLLVTFADGQRRIDGWDGRDRAKTFHYRSPARAVSATVDPDRILLLDLHRTNNSSTLAPQAGTAASTWAGRYMIWLEDLLLSYASLM